VSLTRDDGSPSSNRRSTAGPTRAERFVPVPVWIHPSTHPTDSTKVSAPAKEQGILSAGRRSNQLSVVTTKDSSNDGHATKRRRRQQRRQQQRRRRRRPGAPSSERLPTPPTAQRCCFSSLSLLPGQGQPSFEPPRRYQRILLIGFDSADKGQHSPLPLPSPPWVILRPSSGRRRCRRRRTRSEDPAGRDHCAIGEAKRPIRGSGWTELLRSAVLLGRIPTAAGVVAWR
jgi:hypothetical protein